MSALVLFAVLLTAAEQRGRAVYLTGGSATAVVAGSTELPASGLPCGSCHGPDGRGVPEGTIVPADIRWPVLSRPRLDGRPRPRYDAASLRRAITEGVDAAGEALAPVMPRYRMREDDLAGLVAYLQRLDDTEQPGLSASEVTIGTMPLTGPHAQVGAITRAVLEAVFADVNASGGIYGRKLRLGEASPERSFALLCTPPASVDPLERVPVVTPFAGEPSPSAFFLYPDLGTQVLALAKSAGAESRNVVVVHDGTEAATAAAATLPRGTREKRTDDDLLFLIGNVDVSAELRRLDAQQWSPRVLAAGAAVSGGLLDEKRKISIAIPALPSDLTPEGQRELAALAERHRLPHEQLATQIATYAAAKVLIEGLKRAGHDLTREKLITALEQLYGFATGVTPPITFSRNRHIGAPGTYIVSLPAGTRTYVVP